MNACIVLFCFNRPNLLKQTLECLMCNAEAEQSDIIIYCDGPRNSSDYELVNATRNVAYAAKGFKSIKVVEREKNLGCSESIISGCNEAFVDHEMLIIVEDDILLSSYTLNFLNKCLKKYVNEFSVFNISAWSHPPSMLLIDSDYPYDAYFVPRTNVSCMATWRDRWKYIDWGVSDYSFFSRNRYLEKSFNRGGDDMSSMLAEQMKNGLDSWAIRMDYARFKHGCVGLNPVFSYCSNIGYGSGTHTTEFTSRYDNDINIALTVPRLPDHIFLDEMIVSRYRRLYGAPPIWMRAVNKVSRLLCRRNLLDI